MSGPASVPASIAEVTPLWLGEALSGMAPEAHERTFSSTRIGEGYGLTSELHRCTFVGATEPRSVVLKLWDTTTAAGTREVTFYRLIGKAVGARIPDCFHAAIDEVRQRGVLVLEDLGDVVQGDCLEHVDRDTAAAVARELAGVHAAGWQLPDPAAQAWLPEAMDPRRDEPWFEARRTAFLARFGDGLDARTAQLVHGVGSVQAIARERLAGQPATLLHADLHMDNIVFEEATGRPVLLDWARVARGPAALDVIELLVEIARPEDRDAALATYCSELRRRGVALDPDTFERALGGALLRKAIRSTYGVARWMPASPREERMIATGLARIAEALAAWSARDPELFETWDSSPAP